MDIACIIHCQSEHWVQNAEDIFWSSFMDDDARSFCLPSAAAMRSGMAVAVIFTPTCHFPRDGDGQICLPEWKR